LPDKEHNEDDDDWAEDTSAEAAAARIKALAKGIEKVVLDDSEGTSRCSIFTSSYVESRRGFGTICSLFD
jgi:hypothetical protein